VDLTPYRDFLIQLAQRSGDLIRPYFGATDADLDISFKPQETSIENWPSIVSRADREAEELMREMIANRFPDHGVVGEEYGMERPDAEFVWTLDPIDGTISFVSANPQFGTLIGLLHHGSPVLGVIHQPVLRQLCLGDGTTTTLNGKPVQSRAPRPLSQATLLVTDLRFHDTVGWESLRREVNLVRTWGDCYGYLLVATGHADIMSDPGMHLWDVTPLIPVVRGAGGVITDWQGDDVMAMRSTLATSSQAVHDEVIRMLHPA
jgi:histidinol phosphatase-like enzyme (inositol monophosphatase family)